MMTTEGGVVSIKAPGVNILSFMKSYHKVEMRVEPPIAAEAVWQMAKGTMAVLEGEKPFRPSDDQIDCVVVLAATVATDMWGGVTTPWWRHKVLIFWTLL